MLHVEIEEIRTRAFVVQATTSIRFFFGDDFTGILGNEIAGLGDWRTEKRSVTGD